MTYLSRIIFGSTLLILLFSNGVFAQEEEKPSFEGFSYGGDPVFGPDKARNEQYREWKSSVLQSGPAEVNLDCTPQEQAPVLSEAEVQEMQLALDRTLSNLLKLSVDYDALLVRVDNLQDSIIQRSEEGVSEVGSDGTDQDRLLEAMDLQSKQIIDRDQKIARLEERLVVAQGRFDAENLARLKSEKVIRNQEEQRKSMQLNLDQKDGRLIVLKKQLETQEQQIQQLQSALAAARQAASGQIPAAEASLEACKPEIESRAVVAAELEIEAEPVSEYPLAEEWVLEGLRFEHGSAAIDPNSVGQLKELQSILREQPELSVQINGYTDSVGSSNSNMKLSQERADSVAGYLVRRGIESYRVSALGYGERRPVGDNQTEQGRKRNRRVGVIFLK